MCFRVKGNGLVTRVITGHIAFTTVDTHVLQYKMKKVFVRCDENTNLLDLRNQCRLRPAFASATYIKTRAVQSYVQ